MKLLIKHIGQNNLIYMPVDPDCDGFTGAALFINYLHNLFPSFVENKICYNFPNGKHHGIELDRIPGGTKLVVAIDSSSNDFAEHEILTNNGIDIISIDHHIADFESTNACIINNQLCDYPNKSLSGVGMAYKFCSMIDELLSIQTANNYLDLVALGEIADCMNLKDFETKHLVFKGLRQINNPFFQTMIEKNSFSLKGEITPFGIAFYIAPYVNAVIRVGSQEEKLLLFESMLDFKGNELISSTKRGCKGQEETRVEQACRNCLNIKKKQTVLRDNSLEIIERIIEEENLLDNKVIIVQVDKPIEKTLTGLIANQIMGKYKKPVMILTKNEDDIWSGSVRSPIDNFKKMVENTGYIIEAAGHEQAFGLSIHESSIPAFLKSLNGYLEDEDFSPCYLVDFVYDEQSDIRGNDLLKISDTNCLWAQDKDIALVLIKNIRVNKDNLFLMSPDKNPTLKITLPNGVSLIRFKSSNEEYKKLYSDLGCITISVIGSVEKNVWNGNINLQIIVKDYSIENKQEYYF